MTRVLLGLVVALGLGLRFHAANHPYIGQWDEAYHALVAKNLARHPLTPLLYADKVLPSDDREWTKAGVWLHKPPLPLWLMAGGIAAFGDGELSFRLPSVLLDSLAILLIFLLAEELFGPKRRPAGLIAAFVYAVNPLMIRLVSGRVPDDTPHVVNVFFITLTALLFIRSARRDSRAYAAAAGFSLGLGTLCMSAVALLGLAAALPSFHSERGPRGSARLLAWGAVSCLAVALPWPWYAHGRWPELWRHESSLQLDHLVHALEGHAHAWWWYVKLVPVHYGGSAAAVAALATLGYAGREAWRERAAGPRAALLWAFLPYAFFSLIATKLYSYVAVAVPAAALLAGFAAAGLWSRGRAGRAVVAALLLAAALPRLSADYTVCPWNTLYDYPSFRAAMLELRGVPGPKVILNVGDDKSPQAMYYSGAAAYPDTPTPDLVRSLSERGYRVFGVLDESSRGAAFLSALKKAGLEKKIRFRLLPAPRAAPARHPYEA